MALMSALKDRLRADLTTAIKARDELRSSTLRMVLTAITNAEVAGKEARELSDDDVIGVLSTEAKRRREAAVAFEEAGRTEMAAKEAAEGEVIADYLPAQLSEAEIADLVTAAIDQTGAAGEGMRAMGKVMGVVTPQVKGRADGGAVAAEVRRSWAEAPAGDASAPPPPLPLPRPPCRRPLPLPPPPPPPLPAGGRRRARSRSTCRASPCRRCSAGAPPSGEV